MKYNINTDDSRNELLTDFGKATLDNRYLLENESYQELFARVASYYASNQEHAQRLYDYISKQWFMPATPILSNGGTDRGLPISCFLNEAEDSLKGIVSLWNENVWLASKGGGIGSYWGNIRSIGEAVKSRGKTSGVIPFIRVMDSLTLGISQGSLRRGSAAVYLPVWHPEIEEFVDIRKPTGGDPHRKALNLHNGVLISNKFMYAVENDSDWDLLSPVDNHVVRTIKARSLWIRILTSRIEQGEPYIIYSDNVKKHQPDFHIKAGLEVKTSNLCAEITLPTGRDQYNNNRTAVCCLSSLNLDQWDQWKNNEQFIQDIARFLDNVISDFIEKAPPEMANAVYAAYRERSIGLGVMGFHTLLQSKKIPFGSFQAEAWNKKIFLYIRTMMDKASYDLAKELGPCPDAADYDVMERFAHKIAIAPTASISNICGGVSPGIEPLRANAFVQKTLSGTFSVISQPLKKVLQGYNQDTDEIWSSIKTNNGSVQHLDFLSLEEKEVYQTALEIDQRWIVELAAKRTPYICQSQSVNIFLRPDISKSLLSYLHYKAWKDGLKSLYYCRSISLQRAENISSSVGVASDNTPPETEPKYEECLACQ